MELETLTYGYGLIEGPRVDAEGGVYFSDVRRGGVRRLAPDGAVELIVPRRKGVGGIALHADGGLVISGRDICHVKDGESRILLERPDGVGGFNDLYTDLQGRVYTGSLRSDPFDPDGDRTPGEAYRIDGEGRAERLYGGVGLSNGIGFSPDGRTLYHSDTSAGHVIAHEVNDDGTLGARRIAGEVPWPDGLAVDAEGGIWVACFGAGCVIRLTLEGKHATRLAIPARQVTSVCFGGAGCRDLYVATADNTEDPGRNGTLFRMPAPVPGLPTPMARI